MRNNTRTEYIIKINDLIDKHNEISAYAHCEGCKLCDKIQKVSKKAGFFYKYQKGEKRHREIKEIRASELIVYLNAGMSNKQIAKIFNCSDPYLSKKIKKLLPGYKKKNKAQREKALTIETYRELRDLGNSREEIAEMLELSINQMRYRLYANKEQSKKAN